jgi:hypothetical protein
MLNFAQDVITNGGVQVEIHHGCTNPVRLNFVRGGGGVFLDAAHLARRILMSLPYFWEICAPKY